MPGKTFRCPVCGYIYNTAKGDPAHNIPENTAFFELGDDWKCPLCQADKKLFEPVETEEH